MINFISYTLTSIKYQVQGITRLTIIKDIVKISSGKRIINNNFNIYILFIIFFDRIGF